MRDEVCCLPVGMTAIHCEKGFGVGGQLKSAMYLLLAGSLRQTPHARLLPFRSLQSSNSWTCWGYSGTKASRLTHSTCWKKLCLKSWLCCLLRSLTWTCITLCTWSKQSDPTLQSIVLRHRKSGWVCVLNRLANFLHHVPWHANMLCSDKKLALVCTHDSLKAAAVCNFEVELICRRLERMQLCSMSLCWINLCWEIAY